MQLTRNRASSSGSSEITFPGLESWNPETKMATVAAEVNKTRALCRISLETLKEKFGASGENPMSSIAEHRAAIHKAAKRLMESESFEEDGSVLIRADDIEQ